MSRARITTPRDPACTAPMHSEHGRMRHGCICPPTPAEVRRIRERTRRRRTGPPRVHVRFDPEPDHAVVARMLAGETPTWVSRADRLEAVAILTRRGKAASEIAELIAVNIRTVCRYRAALAQSSTAGA